MKKTLPPPVFCPWHSDWSTWMSLVFLSVFTLSCNSGPSYQVLKEQGEALVESYRELWCAQQALNQKTKALWDGVATSLDEQLPKDMPADERRNIIAIRNTPLIQMFEVYPKLDTGIQLLVEKAGEEDAAIVVKLRQLQLDAETVENEFLNFMGKIEKKYPEQTIEWQNKWAKIKDTACEKTTY